ncbi:MAG TPA: outer membrane protein [Xanthobacteraceae bacterium]|nr:outer membrane protein [Xanthobacteraceae bacterium]
MKPLAVGSFILAAAIAVTAAAADAVSAAELLQPPLIAKVPPPPPPPPFSWSGVYIGGNAGYAWGRSSDTNPFFAVPATGNYAISGMLAGGQLGFNWQYNAVVVGAEGDIDWSNVRGSTSNGLCGGVTCTTSNTWLGTARGRLGIAADHWLFYGTGGLAYGDIKFTDLPAPLVVNGMATNIGWTVGGGVEYAFDRNWSIKAEYLYVGLDNAGFACTVGCGTSSISFNENIVRGGLNFRF